MKKIIRKIICSGIIALMIVAPFSLTGLNGKAHTPTCDLCEPVQIIEPFCIDPGPDAPIIEN